MKTTGNLQKQLTAAQRTRQRIAEGARYSALEGPHVALHKGLKLNLVQGVIYSSAGRDLVAVHSPVTPDDVQRIAEVVACTHLPAGDSAKRAALRDALGCLYRERRTGPKERGTVERTVRLTPAEWEQVEAAGDGRISEGVRALLQRG